MQSSQDQMQSLAQPIPQPIPEGGLDEDYQAENKQDNITIYNYLNVNNDKPVEKPIHGLQATIPRSVCYKMATFFSTSLDNDRDSSELFLLNKVSENKRIFDYLITFLEMHIYTDPITEITKPLKSQDLEQALEYDKADDNKRSHIKKLVEFINNIHFIDLFLVLDIANYIDCPSLLELCSAKIATFLRNKSEEEIQELFVKSKLEHQKLFTNDPEYNIIKNVTNSGPVPMELDTEQKHQE
jgi:hypothetical protein